MKTSLRLDCERPQIATSRAGRKVFLSSAVNFPATAVTLGVTGGIFRSYPALPDNSGMACTLNPRASRLWNPLPEPLSSCHAFCFLCQPCAVV